MKNGDQAVNEKLEQMAKLFQRGGKRLHTPSEEVRSAVEKAVRAKWHGVEEKKESVRESTEQTSDGKSKKQSQSGDSNSEKETKTRRHGHSRAYPEVCVRVRTEREESA